MYYGILEIIISEYKWNIEEVEALDLYEALFFCQKINTRKQEQAELEIRRLQLLTSAIHSGDPQEFVEYLDEVLEGDSNVNNGLEELERLKTIRHFQGKGG